ncbi:MAG: MBL fold metallo-hydrolase [Acidobacteria bacterium]|nr:MBL fold metallo-hydrolase [Acidobacteriota bacterium]
MIAGAGGNIAVQVGEDGVLLVDTGRAESSRGVIDTIKGLTDKPIRQIINTHVHEHHTGGNEAFTRLGVPIIAHENTLNRMSAPTGEPPPRPSSAWPTDTFFTTKKELFFNGEAIEILHQPAAHTDGDVFVYFRRSDVVVTGDIFVTTHFPVIDVERGGSIDGLIAALNRLMDITIPRRNQEGGTYVIPGVGRLCDEADVVEFRDMVTIVRDRVRHMIEKGMTLAQAKAAAPALDYEGRWGSTGGQWTADGFVEAVFNDLSKKDRR